MSTLDALNNKVRLGMFISVGLIGSVFDFSVLLLSTQIFSLSPEVGAFFGIESAILVMFFINEHWTYKDHGKNGTKNIFSRLVRSHLVRGVGATTHLLVFIVVYNLFHIPIFYGEIDLWLVVSKAVGICVAFFANYTFESLYTWKIQTN